MKSSIKLLGTALLLGAALTTAASAHDTRGTALVNLTATVLPTTSHGNSTGLAAVTANVGNIVGAKVNVGGGSLLGNGTLATVNTGSLLASHSPAVSVNTGALLNTVGSAVHTVGSVVNTTAGSVLNNTTIKANVGNSIGAKLDLGGGVGSEHHGVGW